MLGIGMSCCMLCKGAATAKPNSSSIAQTVCSTIYELSVIQTLYIYVNKPCILDNCVCAIYVGGSLSGHGRL